MEIAPMDFATGQKAKRNVVGLLGMLVIGMGVVSSGGCANQQEDQIAQLNSEIAALKEEKAQVEQARIAAELRAQEAAAKQAAAPAPQPGAGTDYMNGYGGPSGQPERDVVITVAGDVLFASGQVTLKPEAKRELDQVARELENRYASNRIRVEGYTDSDPIRKSRFASNEALSQARAEAVEQYLISRGVSAGRISAVGMGSAKPKSTKAASRRVEIVIMGR
jgi:outer membrane protein OmpA-like peptidoglycan-associated protein